MMRAVIITGVLVFLNFSPASAALKFGERAPIFTLNDMEGNSFSLSDAVGPGNKDKARGVILSFFASWCGPCRKELPIINALVNEYKSRGIKVVLVDVKETRNVTIELLRELNVDRPVVLGDWDGKVNEKYGIRFLPTTYFIGSDGTIRDVIFGEIKNAYELNTSAKKLLQ